MSDEAKQSPDQFEDTPRGWAARWRLELEAARKAQGRFPEQGAKVVKFYLDERDEERAGAKKDSRWNLFTANVETQQSLLYGKTPKVSASRRFSDSADDLARVAAVMLERLMNGDIERSTDGFPAAMRHALDDWLLPGLGVARLRYVCEWESGEAQPAILGDDGSERAPAVPAAPRKGREDVETDYVHWRDNLWSPCRVWSELRWWAFRAEMTLEQLKDKFGEQVADSLPLRAGGKTKDSKNDMTGGRTVDPWSRAEVWEVWDREHRCVWWYVDGYSEVLRPLELLDEMQEDIEDGDDEAAGQAPQVNANGSLPDPLGLDAFFPFARPLMSLATTDKLVPKPEFCIAEDIYRDINALSTRIKALTDAVKVRGIYDQSTAAIAKLLDGPDGQMFPVQNWRAFAEKGGVQGSMQFLPIDMIVAAIDKLEEKRQGLMGALYQITGMSDIMRGQAQSSATATEQEIKAKFGSVRIQRKQEEFARFCSETQAIRAEIIAKHFDPQTIIERSNVLATPDAQMAGPAVQLIQSETSRFRIEVKPEAVSLTDYAATKQERSEVLAAIGGFVAQMAPVASMLGPGAAPAMLQMLQWMVAGLKGASTIEGVLDQAVAQATQAAKQPPPPPQPDPKLQVAQVKAGAEVQRAKLDMAKGAMDAQATQQEHLMKMEQLAVEQQKMRLEMDKFQAQHAAAMDRATMGGVLG